MLAKKYTRTLFQVSLSILLLLSSLLAACNPNKTSGPTTAAVTPPSGTLPSPVVQVTQPPDAKSAVETFLGYWKANNFAGMYDMINGVSKDAFTVDQFTATYQKTVYNLTLKDLDFSVLSALTYPASAQVAYRVDFHSNLLGELSRDMQMNLSLENGSWKVAWEEGLILPELKGGNHLQLDVKFPSRGNIYDRNGQIIATNTDAVALGVIPGQVNPKQEDTLIFYLNSLTGIPKTIIQSIIDNSTADWYVGIGEASSANVQEVYDQLSGLDGVVISDYTGRYYDQQGVATQVVGYALGIPADQVDAYKRMGYTGDEKVGWAGLEKWGESWLAGSPSASLYVVAPDGKIISRIVQSDPKPSQDIYTTIDKDLQIAAQKALYGLTGAIVVMERDTGKVLAMVSSPDIDPNLFDPNNKNSANLSNLLNDGEQRLWNRATQSSYPLGSVYKIIVMAAALESGLYTAQTTYNCQHTFTEIPDLTLYDWTFEKGFDPSGMLNLPEGLMRSCDTYFYHIALDLFRQKGANFVVNMSNAFGLGKATGIEQVAEDTGSVPVPPDEREAVQQGIGQGTLLVTPLQVADFIAAVGNGGTLYRPQVIEKITTPNGEPTYSFTPQVNGTLPITAAHLETIQGAMREVVANFRGTAYRRFLGIGVPIYGKTGTASTSDPTRSHAWFAGYTNSGGELKKDISVVVLVEFGGEGSDVAAPIFRRVIESYFGMTPILYPWETSLYVTKTPTPEGTGQPTP
jgi:penicillin-binding protein 2